VVRGGCEVEDVWGIGSTLNWGSNRKYKEVSMATKKAGKTKKKAPAKKKAAGKKKK